ncbi:hypothetical protein Bbelb_103290 [Branchiostoma belcheri]|nr:hypothetical protein Bbelb_103290 [Branchiostoma belcheri]
MHHMTLDKKQFLARPLSYAETQRHGFHDQVFEDTNILTELAQDVVPGINNAGSVFDIKLRYANSYYLSTPSGRIELPNSADVSMMKNLPVMDSGVYTFVAEKGEARSRPHSVTQTSAADTALSTRAEIHQYSNDDTPGHSGDTEEGQDHYASAAPPPLPVCDGYGPGATGPDPLQPGAGQPVCHMDETESDEEERPYGMATENPVYEDTNLNQSHPTPYYCAVNVNQSESTPSVSRSSLYGQQPENTDLNLSNPTPCYCAVNENQVETTCSLSRNSLYGQQPENMTAAHDSARTTEDLDILYESCQATDE